MVEGEEAAVAGKKEEAEDEEKTVTGEAELAPAQRSGTVAGAGKNRAAAARGTTVEGGTGER